MAILGIVIVLKVMNLVLQVKCIVMGKIGSQDHCCSLIIYPIEKLVIPVDVYKSLGKNDVYMHLKDCAYDKFKNNVSKFIKENLGDINKFVEPFLVYKEKYKEEKQKFTSNNPRKGILKYVYFKKMQKEIGSKYVETTHMNFESIINKPITID